MPAFSVATGIALLRDEGVLPPNPAREAVAFTSAAEDIKLGSDGFAMKETAAVLAMQDESGNGTVLLSSAAMQALEQDLAAPSAAPQKSHPTEPAAASATYSATTSPDSVPADTTSTGAVANVITPVLSNSSINVLA